MHQTSFLALKRNVKHVSALGKDIEFCIVGPPGPDSECKGYDIAAPTKGKE